MSLPSIPADCRCTYWRVLHKALRTEAWHACYPAADDPRQHDPFCRAAACGAQRVPTTIGHVVWACPIARAAWSYASAFLSAASQGLCPILIHHLLPSDPSHLPPPGIPPHARPLLRLVVAVMMHHLTAPPRAPRYPGEPLSALEVIAAFQDTIRTTIRADWLRVHLEDAMGDGQEASLTRSLRPWSRAQFDSLWLGEGAWFHPLPALPGRRAGLAVYLDLTTPVSTAPYAAVN